MTTHTRLGRLEQLVKPKATTLLGKLASFDYKEAVEIDRHIYFDEPLPPEISGTMQELNALSTQERTVTLNQLKALKGWDKLPLWLFLLTDTGEELIK